MTYRIITAAIGRLITFLDDAISRSLEPIRVARTATALLLAGNKRSGNLFQRTVEQLIQSQRPDGGWTDPEETAWAAGTIIFVYGNEDAKSQAALQWLNKVRQHSGGWGRHPRDQARIPITALISFLVPAAFKSEDLNGLKNEWAHDLRGPVRLSYKAGFYLLAMPKDQKDELVKQTIDHLAQDQNDDGGFAPWRGHPIGSDPWSTGVVLWGLSRWVDHVDHAVLEKALNWLQETQLPSGCWSYHYLDDGTSLALIGSVAALKSLKTRE
ncbi:MAG: hypothetical protein JRE23_14245 [Deltaproteobacteria bacterium]|nr:hypothetical protein [Deltaproteobacteria bacterium]